jgi:hypothetical protein
MQNKLISFFIVGALIIGFFGLITVENVNAKFGDRTDYSVPAGTISGENPHGIEIGDVTNDGKDDMVSANPYPTNPSISIWRQTGSGFATRKDHNIGGNRFAFRLAIGDVDSDSNNEIVTGNWGISPITAQISVFHINSNGGVASRDNYAANREPNDVAIGEVTNDNNNDVVAVCQNSNKLSVYEYNPVTNKLKSKVDYGCGGTTPRFVTIGNIDSDSRNEVIVCNSANIRIFDVTAGGTLLIRATSYSVTPRGAVIEDIDGDSDNDLIVSEQFRLAVFLQDSNGNLPTNPSYYVGDDPSGTTSYWDLAKGDLNSDDITDYIVGQYQGSSTVGDRLTYFVMNEDGKLDFELLRLLPPTSPTWRNHLGVATGKLNSGSLIDVACTNGDDDSISTFMQQTNEEPTISHGGPYIEDEGTAVNFDASGSSDNDGDTIYYRWDFNSDGTWDHPTSGFTANPKVSKTWYDDHSSTVTLQIHDGTVSVTDQTSLNVYNVAPVADIGGNLVPGVYIGAINIPITFLASSTDPANPPNAPMVHDTPIYGWDFDSTDGWQYGTPGNPAWHLWTEPGTYLIRVLVDDQDGGTDWDEGIVIVTP